MEVTDDLQGSLQRIQHVPSRVRIVEHEQQRDPRQVVLHPLAVVVRADLAVRSGDDDLVRVGPSVEQPRDEALVVGLDGRLAGRAGKGRDGGQRGGVWRLR